MSANLSETNVVKVEVLTMTRRIAMQIKTMSGQHDFDPTIMDVLGYVEHDAFERGSSPYILIRVKSANALRWMYCSNIPMFCQLHAIKIGDCPQIFLK